MEAEEAQDKREEAEQERGEEWKGRGESRLFSAEAPKLGETRDWLLS